MKSVRLTQRQRIRFWTKLHDAQDVVRLAGSRLGRADEALIRKYVGEAMAIVRAAK